MVDEFYKINVCLLGKNVMEKFKGVYCLVLDDIDIYKNFLIN